MAWIQSLNVRSSQRLARRANSPPAPIVIAASQDFDGPDGPWSSFAIQVGTSAQTVKVLLSTASYQTLVILPQGCSAKDPSNCESSRGRVYHPEQSHTWIPNNLVPNGTFSFGLESNLGYNSNGEYGYDTLTLDWEGSGGPSLQHQIVAGIATKDFYMGLFGINPRPSNFTNFDNAVPSFMSNLKNKSMIPSLTYGYTSGNQYRLNKILASLTLGGYDASRFIPNHVSFPFDQIDKRDLTVSINSVTMIAADIKTSLMSTGIRAFIDSTIPYLYLPVEVCKNFEYAFGLTFNDTVQAYLVNNTLHQRLLKQNASVTFSLGSPDITETVDISLPYSAFDLMADYPLMPNASRYFPLMRATNDTQYTLGRTFLQEAYLIADYERFNFSVSQCDWSSASQQRNIVPIKSISSAVHLELHSVRIRIMAGTVVGGIIAMLLIVILIHFGYSRVRALFAVVDSEKPELDGQTQEDRAEMSNDFLNPELDGEPHLGAELEDEMIPRLEAQDSQNRFSRLHGRRRFSTNHEADGNQDWVPELQGNDGPLEKHEAEGNQDWVPEMPERHQERNEPPA